MNNSTLSRANRLQATKADAPKFFLGSALHRHKDRCFAFRSAPAGAFFLSAHEGFVHFHPPGQMLATRANHHTAKFLQPPPTPSDHCRTRRWRRGFWRCGQFSEPSSATCHETINAMACGCLPIPSPPWPNSVAGTLGHALGHDPCATPSWPGIPDRQNHPATESTPDTPRSLPRSNTTPETPQTSAERGFALSPARQ
jgi:hypothetical protein